MILAALLALPLLASDSSTGIQTTTLLAQGAPPLERLGVSVDVENGLAAVGAPIHGAGRVYLYRPGAGGQWSHVATLTAADGRSGDRFGASVSVVWSSPPIVVVGAPDAPGSGTARGAAYVFRNFEVGGDQWVQDVKLAPSDVSDFAEFGASVSATGTTVLGKHRLVIGAWLDSSASPFIAHGSAYLYEYTTAGATLQAKLLSPSLTSTGLFGTSVAAENDYAAIGEPLGPSGSSGKVYVYRHDGSAWTGPAVVTPSDAADGQEFGRAICMSSTFLAVGAPDHDVGGNNAGAAYVFERAGANSWSQLVGYFGSTPGGQMGKSISISTKGPLSTQLLVGRPNTGEVFEELTSNNVWGALSPVVPFDGTSGVGFGTSVAVGIYPATFVGAPLDDEAGMNAGAVYVNDTGTNMLIETKELPTYQHQGSAFGGAVAGDGDRVVVGAAGESTAGQATGAAYVLQRSGSAWNQAARLSASPNERHLAAFGSAVAVDGDTIAVGARLDDIAGLFAGAVYVFRESGSSWVREARLADAGPFDELGSSVALRGDLLAAGAPKAGTGVVRTYVRSGSTWTAGSVLTPVGGGNIDRFGASLAMSADYLVVGAPEESISILDAGAVHVFARSGSAWTHVQKLSSVNAAPGEFFGHSVDVDDERIVVGAPGNDSNGTNAGAIYVFRRGPGNSFAFEYAGLPSGGTPHGSYGRSVALRGNEIAVGAHNDGNVAPGAGAGYLLRWQGFLWVQEAVMPPVDLATQDFRGSACAFAGPTLLFGAIGWDGPERPDLGALQAFDVPPGNLLYCAGKTNSIGCVPFMTYSGQASASSSSPFLVSAFNTIPAEPGFLLYGFAKANLGFHGGKLCIKAPFRRLLPPKAAPPFGPPPCDGLLERNFNNRIQSGADPLLTVGQTVFAQWRMRDASDPAGFGDSLTDGLRFSVCP